MLLERFFISLDHLIWGPPLTALILAGGIVLTLRLRLLQIRRLPLALRWMLAKEDAGEGEISAFAALCTALSATIGTGNIVGVAAALCTGGPGALFWMLVAALLGMTVKYAEGFLAIQYRIVDQNRHSLGGPFYYIELGMGKSWKWLARLFAFFGACAGLFGIGTFTQVNGISGAVQHFYDPNRTNLISLPFLGTIPRSVVLTSLILTLCTAAVLLGGIRRIASVSQIVVPFMAVTYFGLCMFLILCNLTAVPQAVKTIVQSAFHPSAFTGGAVGSLFTVIQTGVARGIFSNEAGLGSAPIAAAAAKTNDPIRQGLISMTGTFIDTIIICTLTGLSIVLTGAWKIPGLEGAQVTAYAFEHGLPFPPRISSYLLMVCLIFFAFTTILGWNYYGERCLEYLTGRNEKALRIYRRLYIFSIFIGPYLTMKAVWTIADIFNGLMALPNMIAIFALSGVVVQKTREYFRPSRFSDAD